MKKNQTYTGWSMAAAALTMAGAVAAPQAMAASKAEHALQATDSKVQALEAQIQQMSQMLQSLQGELSNVRTAASRNASENTAKVQELDQWMASVRSAPASVKSYDDNMVFFRGGWTHYNSGRFQNTLGLPGGPGKANQISGQNGWYFGAGFDFGLNDDLFGLMDNTQLAAELLVNYKQLANGAANNVLAAGTGAGAKGIATVNQLTIGASPKIKFMKGSKFRPWLIPIGFQISVISPPSSSITVMAPGMQFGAGADYNIWKSLYVGVDTRYHWVPNSIGGVNVSNVTAGGYLGIGF